MSMRVKNGSVSVMVGGANVCIHRIESEYVEFPVRGTPEYVAGYRSNGGVFHTEVSRPATAEEITDTKRLLGSLRYLYQPDELVQILGEG